ncbi:MAG: TonB-dependent receptor [Chitinophagaceae bacterium]|nr:TonB-dependent receptor [Chitinophagaceae bacterium]
MRKFALLSALLYLNISLFAQNDTLKEKDLDEVTVFSNKFAAQKKFLSQKVAVITKNTIANYNSQNAGDLLINTGNVFVQKSQQGGSSPVIRGFEASRVLLVVDGMRMNNAIYRSGHLQNIITVDQNMLEQAEVMYGPSSTIFGSDALGGIVHFRTKTPQLSSGKMLATGAGFVRYSSANSEKTVHADLSLGGQKFGWLQSYTYSDFGDMKMGDSYPSKYPGFGRRSQYIASINGIDSVVNNSNDRIQKFSGYSQWDISQKLLYKPNDKVSHLLNFQYSSSSDVPRYDRLQDTRNFGGSIGTTLRYAEWFYGPQTRFLGAYELSVAKAGFLDEIKLNLNYQDVKESRQQREYRRYDRFDSRREHVKVAAFNLDGKKTWGGNSIVFGIDGQLNDVKSVADRTNLTTGAVTKLDTRYPDGKNTMNFFGVYAQHSLKMKKEKWILNDGIRFQTVSLKSNIVDNSFFNFPFTEIKQSPVAVTGNIGLTYLSGQTTRITGNFSSGFRAPNIDDVTKIFESSSVSKRLVIPNPDIKPEYTYNFDLGLTKNFASAVRFELNGFYTIFNNALSTAPFKLNGQDSVVYNGVNSAIFASQNINKANVLGFSTRLKFNFSKTVSFDNTLSYTYGRFRNPDGSKKPMDHIPPVFGKTSLQYKQKALALELYGMFNGWKKIKDYNPDGEDNGQYATADGMPSWFTLNWRGNYSFKKYLSIQAGIENILDRNYRYFASGFSAPGRNFILALRVKW